MTARQKLRVTLLAVAGLVVAAGLGAATSEITSQQVGLSGEPPSVGEELVFTPAEGDTADRRRQARRRRQRQRHQQAGAGEPASATPTTTTTAPGVASPPIGEGDSGPEGGDGDGDSDD